MRSVLLVLALLMAAPAAPVRAATADASAPTPQQTARGTRFMLPPGWTLARDGAVVLLTPPEGEGRIAFVDSTAANPDEAVEAAWSAAGIDRRAKLLMAIDRAPEPGWQAMRNYDYDAGVNARRAVFARAFKADGKWTTALVDLPEGLLEKRLGQLIAIFDRLAPAGYSRETFDGKTPHRLDAARVKALQDFIVDAQRKLQIPGVSWGLVQDGRIVHVGGEGVREAGKPGRVDGDTLYIIASNTKALTTLMLARQVEAGRFRWDTPVTTLMPAFSLGDADTTRRVQVQHLVCACTGLPRQDLEWIMEFKGAMPADTLRTLAGMQPTSDFGALYQYSNPLASAGGYVGAHVLYPGRELGQAYDDAMRTQVFEPLGMNATTFDFKRALATPYAAPHDVDLDVRVRVLPMDFNYAILPVRPAGGAWSSARDLLQYVRMELDGGKLPDGSRYISTEALAERVKPKVAIGNDAVYGMGLETDTTWGVPVVLHGGSMLGYKSNMMWLPGRGVGAVILTNSDTGQSLLGPFQRRLLEVLFDGEPRAAEQVDQSAKRLAAQRETARKEVRIPAEPEVVAGLAARYRNDALGVVDVRRSGTATVFDFGEWSMDMGSHRDAKGDVALRSISAGVLGFDFAVGRDGDTRTLTLRDPQREYVFREVR